MKARRNKEKEEYFGWMKLQTDQLGFLGIIHSVNRFYDSLQGSQTKELRYFRRKLVRTDFRYSKIFMKKFGDYEYLIYARIETKGKSESDSWIHIDGIKMERDEMRAKGVKDHPSYEIRCLSDIFESSCAPASKSEEDKIDSDCD
ncbi:LIC_13246 family protein [Leptospira licerasiae]|uniref:LIC_13246 family protein n=1 Tax=Leptospira licerasiae TaxID=447106 RepID=UPI00301A921D